MQDFRPKPGFWNAIKEPLAYALIMGACMGSFVYSKYDVLFPQEPDRPVRTLPPPLYQKADRARISSSTATIGSSQVSEIVSSSETLRLDELIQKNK